MPLEFKLSDQEILKDPSIALFRASLQITQHYHNLTKKQSTPLRGTSSSTASTAVSKPPAQASGVGGGHAATSSPARHVVARDTTMRK